jgi:hypothetical protein
MDAWENILNLDVDVGKRVDHQILFEVFRELGKGAVCRILNPCDLKDFEENGIPIPPIRPPRPSDVLPPEVIRAIEELEKYGG